MLRSEDTNMKEGFTLITIKKYEAVSSSKLLPRKKKPVKNVDWINSRTINITYSIVYNFIVNAYLCFNQFLQISCVNIFVKNQSFN